MNHPEELLAPFVDGTASVDERALVEAHLLFCQTCRQEMEESRRALAALGRLPELEAPALDLPGVFEPAADQPGSAAASMPDELATDTPRDGSSHPAGRQPDAAPPMRRLPGRPEPSSPLPSTGRSRMPRS